MGSDRIVLSLLCLAVSLSEEQREDRLTSSSHDVAPKGLFSKTFDRVYSLSDGRSMSPPVNPQDIALVFIIMALGTVFNIEMPMHDSTAEDWLHLSERALVKGDFLSNNTLAGLQTLVSFSIGGLGQTLIICSI